MVLFILDRNFVSMFFEHIKIFRAVGREAPWLGAIDCSQRLNHRRTQRGSEYARASTFSRGCVDIHSSQDVGREVANEKIVSRCLDNETTKDI